MTCEVIKFFIPLHIVVIDTVISQYLSECQGTITTINTKRMCFTPKTLTIYHLDLNYLIWTIQRNWCPQQLGKLLSFLNNPTFDVIVGEV